MTSARVTVVAALGATQTIAWASSYYMPAILGAPIARTLHSVTQSLNAFLFVAVMARQAALNLKLVLQYSLRVDRPKCHYPVPLQFGAGDNPFLEPRARHRVHPWLATRARPVTQSLNAFLFVAVYAIRRPLTGSAQPAAPLPHAPSLRGTGEVRPCGKRCCRRLQSADFRPSAGARLNREIRPESAALSCVFVSNRVKPVAF